MKHLMISSVSAMIIATLGTPAFSSEEVAAVNLRGSRTVRNSLAPITLVQLAYQGYFKPFGIPSHGGFKRAIISNRIDAEDLVKSAIVRGRLSASVLNNQEYLNIVKAELYSLRSR